MHLEYCNRKESPLETEMLSEYCNKLGIVFYKDKTQERVNLMLKNINLEQGQTNINGIQIPSLSDQLKNIDCSLFSGVVLDESSILKGWDGKLSNLILDNSPYVDVSGFINNELTLSESIFINSGALILNSLPAKNLLFNP
jgi:hypothetical protein